MHKQKTIFLLIPELGMGGAQHSLAKLSLELDQYFNVFIIIFNKNHYIPYEYGGILLSLDVNGGNNLIVKLLAFLKRLWRLRQLKNLYKPSTSISFLEGADFINILTKKREKIIVSIRGSKIHDETIQGKLGVIRKKLFIPLLYRKADFLIPVNSGIKEELVNHFHINPKKINVINNFYDLKKINVLAAEPLSEGTGSFFEKNKVLIMSGRLAIEKGHKYIIKIFSEVKKQINDIKLVFIGDGPEYSHLKNLCSSLQLSHSDHLSFHSSVDVLFIRNEKNIFKYLTKAHIYILCSSSEGFPNGIAEAMACGLPVVSTDCPYGPREIMAPETSPTEISQAESTPYGLLMPMLNTSRHQEAEKVWEKNLIKTLSDPALLTVYATNAKERMQDFITERLLSDWLALIELNGAK